MLRPTSSLESIRLGLGGDALGTRLVPALSRYLWGPGLRRRGLEKSEHRQHQGSLVHPLGLRASGNQARSLSQRTRGLVHLWGLTVGQSSLHRRVRVDVLGHSTQRLTNKKKSRRKHTRDEHTFLNVGSGSSDGDLMEESKQKF
jgi:hypothetical protein